MRMRKGQRSALKQAQKAYEERTRMKGGKYADKNYQKELKLLRRAIAEAFAEEGQLTLSEQRRKYKEDRTGWYGMSYPPPLKDVDAINLQEIIDPGAGREHSSVGLLGGMYFSHQKGKPHFSVKISSRARMKPYPEELPSLSMIYYLNEGWESEEDDRSMVGRNITGYLAKKVDIDNLLVPFYRKIAVDTLMRIGKSNEDAKEEIITVFRG